MGQVIYLKIQRLVLMFSFFIFIEFSINPDIGKVVPLFVLKPLVVLIMVAKSLRF